MSNSELIQRMRTVKEKIAYHNPNFDLGPMTDVEDMMNFGTRFVEWVHMHPDESVTIGVLCPTHSIDSGWVWGSMLSDNHEIEMHNKAETFLEAWTQMLEWIIDHV